MKQILSTLLPVALLTMLLSACAAFHSTEPALSVQPTAAPAATVAAPSATPVSVTTATATPVPATATAAPTATEAATPAPATPDPNQNVGKDIYADAFDGRSGWYWTFNDDVASFAAKDGQLTVETKQGNNTWRYVVRDDLNEGDQQISVKAGATACPGNDEYGVMFRTGYNPDQSIRSYIFLLNCAGQARLELLDGTIVHSIVDWTTYAAVRPGAPAENAITLWMSGDQIRAYVNDTYLFTAHDTTLEAGFYGFFAASHSSGGGVFSFKELAVKQVTAP